MARYSPVHQRQHSLSSASEASVAERLVASQLHGHLSACVAAFGMMQTDNSDLSQIARLGRR